MGPETGPAEDGSGGIDTLGPDGTTGESAPPATMSEDGSGEGTSGGPDPMSTTSGTDSGTTMGVSDGSSSTTGSEDICETVLCGPTDQCCDALEECVLDSCLAQCDSGVRCGDKQDVCCDDGQVCLGNACTDPGGPCVDSFDCPLGEFCEPTLGACFPQFEPVSCEVEPDFEDIDVVEEWSWEVEEIISIPVVADVDGDNAPEVVVNLTQMDGGSWPGGEVVILDGTTGALQLQIDHDPPSGTYGAHGRSTLGLSDVDGDGVADIVYAGRESGGASLIHAVDGAGNLLWTSHDSGGFDYAMDVENGAPSFANLDGDPEAEIVFGAAILDNDGLVVWDEAGVGPSFGTNNNYTGGISALVDLDADAYPEVVSGRHAWQIDWDDMVAPPSVTVTEFWDAGAPDGYPAIADVDLDGDPEVALIADGTLRILDGATGELWCGIDPTDAMCVADPTQRTQPVPIPDGGRGGPPTVADFDDDGRPEIATAGGGSYTVYDLYRAGEDVVVPIGDPMPSAGEIYPRWSVATQDQSSNATGSSVFDFQGDGIAEVVYADECYMRVYSGADGAVLLELENSSATIHEYPLVVDVDDDGNSEILVVANDSHSSCSGIGGYTERRGLFAYGDAFDRWVGTRRVWNQHAYHVTNATSAGNVPAVELDNWTQPGLNNYRQNVQGAGVFNAPDLTVELNADLGSCDDHMLEIVATVRNIGTLGVAAGIDVTLYEGVDDTGLLIGTQLTPTALLPGGFAQLSWFVPFAPGDAALDLYATVDGPDVAVECEEDNNADTLVDAECLFPG